MTKGQLGNAVHMEIASASALATGVGYGVKAAAINQQQFKNDSPDSRHDREITRWSDVRLANGHEESRNIPHTQTIRPLLRGQAPTESDLGPLYQRRTFFEATNNLDNISGCTSVSLSTPRRTRRLPAGCQSLFK